MVDWFTCVGELDTPIVIYPIAVRALGGYAEAAFVGQLRYWMGRCSNPDGWVYKTSEDWERELCLTSRQQEYVRENLKKLEILETWHEREKHLLHYRIKKDVFNALFEAVRAVPKNVGAHKQSHPVGVAVPKNVGGSPKKRSSFNTESTTEITTESTDHPPSKSSQKSKPAFQYSTFQSRYYSLTGTTPSKAPFLVSPYLELCAEYGEEVVLDLLPEWVKGQGGEKALRGNRYGPGNFLEQVGIMLTTDRVDVTEDKEKQYPQGTVKKTKWNDYDKMFGGKRDGRS